jgi:hypothetical protein
MMLPPPGEAASKVLAITLNWRQPEMTLDCVNALQAMAQSHLDILVIDNGSGDGSVQQLQERLPANVALLPLSENLGFAAGCNVGLQQAIDQDYTYALLINNDAFAAPDMLTELLKEISPDIALLSPKIYYASDPERLWFSGSHMNRWTLDLQKTGRNQLDGAAWQESVDVDYLLGTCLLVNLAAIQQVGLLDKIFFMYFEDLDWSLRLRQTGLRLRLVAQAHLFHAVAVSSGGLETPSRRYHLARSGVIFWRRHARVGNPIAIFLFRLGSSLKMVIRLLVKGKTAVLKAYLRGLRDGWCASA